MKPSFKALAFLTCLLLSVKAHGLQYQIRDLPPLPGDTNCWALGLNNEGDVVGMSYNVMQGARAVVWTSSGMAKELPSLPGCSSTYAYDINDKGQAVGYSYSSGAYQAIIWDNSDNPTPIQGMTGATAINNAGQVVGANALGAALWDSVTGTHSLGVLPGYSVTQAYDVNDDGMVVGDSNDGYRYFMAFAWDSGRGIRSLSTLGPGGSSSQAFSINNHGWVTGTSELDFGECAFIWSEATGMKDLGTLGGCSSYGNAINDLGQVVGLTDTAIYGQTHAFLWDETHGMQDLGPWQYSLLINNRGQLTSTTYTESGTWQAVIWEPVPEPCSMLVLVSGVGILLRKRRLAGGLNQDDNPVSPTRDARLI